MVLEEMIIQGESLAVLHCDLVNCIRVTAVRNKNGKIVIYYPWIKAGIGGSILRRFSVLNKKHNIPVNELLLIGVLSLTAPFFGRIMLVWISDAAALHAALLTAWFPYHFLFFVRKNQNCTGLMR